MSFAKSYQALRAFAPRSLNDGAYARSGAHCVLGALVPETRTVRGTAICRLAEVSPSVRRGLRRLGLTARQASELQTINDTFEGTQAARYVYVLGVLAARSRAEARRARAKGAV